MPRGFHFDDQTNPTGGRNYLVRRFGFHIWLFAIGYAIMNDFATNTITKKILIFVTAIVGALAAPQANPNEITIIKQEEQNNIGVGGYHFSYEQSDGQKREETAELKNEGTDDEFLDVTGSFSFLIEYYEYDPITLLLSWIFLQNIITIDNITKLTTYKNE
ncbi:hypothetical protein WN51_11605 [Melipona quadrifasciata]|uniref:Flexible cuticle protein 12 n=1 Tax=Melipona quadrifasciata TaxID=166423 RepID=A0A0N0U5X6_9HYME|nr:hypothetical protein WN51_11605 [Melipona quadrifasciata]